MSEEESNSSRVSFTHNGVGEKMGLDYVYSSRPANVTERPSFL